MKLWNYLLRKRIVTPNSSLLVEQKNTCLHQWTNVTVNEMKQFIGILILMGIVNKPQIPMYWSKSEHLSTPVFGNQFYLLLKFLHFNDDHDLEYDVNSEERDRLHKIRPFLKLI